MMWGYNSTTSIFMAPNGRFVVIVLVKDSINDATKSIVAQFDHLPTDEEVATAANLICQGWNE